MAGWNDPNILSKMKLPAGAGAASIPGGTAGVPAPAMPVPSGQPQTPTASTGAVPPAPQNTSYYGANTNPGVTPTYGFGGQAYGNLDAAGRTAMASDENRLRSDNNYLQSEWDRSNNVLASRQGAGMDTKDQLEYLQKLQGYGAGTTPMPAQSPTPQSASAGTPGPTPQSYGMTTDQIQAEAAARIAKQRTALAQSVNATKTGLKNTFDYQTGITNDRRTLENGTFQRNNSPFSGQTDYLAANMLRDRGIQDTAANKDYAAATGAADQKLADFDTLAPEQQQALFDQLNRIERDYGIQVGTLTGTFGGQRTLAGQGQDANFTGQYGGHQTLQAQNQNFNQGISQAGVTGQYNGSPTMALQNQNFNQGIAQAGLTGNYNGDRTIAGQNADLNSTQVMATLTGKMPDGTPTNAAQQQQLINEWKVADETGKITPTLAQMYGIPAGTSTQAAKQFAQSLAIQQQQANTSAQSANTSAASQASSASNAKTNQLLDVWKTTGSAPSGLESLGIAKDTKYSTEAHKSLDAQGTIAGDLAKATSKEKVTAYFNANAAHFVPIVGQDTWEKMKTNALAQYDKVTPVDKQETTAREKAIAAAQKDTRWDLKNADRNALIKEYEAYYK